jgi:hypothetical protein
MGDYQVSDFRLGDTTLSEIKNSSVIQYRPGQTLPMIRAVRISATVDNLSLNAVVSPGDVPTGVVSFTASTKTLASAEPLDLQAGEPINIQGTLYNGDVPPGRDFWVVSVPPPESVAPFNYVLDGIVVDEPSANPTITKYGAYGGPYTSYMNGLGTAVRVHSQILFGPPETNNPSPGTLFGVMMRIVHAGVTYRGLAQDASYAYDEPTTNVISTDITMPFDVYGADIWMDWSFELTTITLWKLYDTASALRSTPRTASTDAVPTEWMVAPLPDPDEIWIDVVFPNGLVQYGSGGASGLSVDVTAEFRRVGATVVQATRALPTFVGGQTGRLQRTDKFTAASLALPGSGGIETRLKRITPVRVDTGTNQYVDETRWASYRAVKYLPPRAYPDATLIQLALQNTTSAASIGENSFNAIATRILPTWTGSAWSDSAPTDKWADNLVARMKAADGANKTDAEIDLAGIYAIQATLDAQDGGDQGKISFTLDEMQDIDTELQAIASIVRCQIYRIGRKLFATRDQGGKTPLALFTGRSKSAEGEQVQFSMQNDGENDAVITTWYDRTGAWKQREYQYPESVVPLNPLRVMPVQSTWAQAWRRALYEWNRINYRRDALSMEATEEARLIHIGDVVQVTDDIANLAQLAGEVYAVAGLTLTLDRDVNLSAGGFTIMLRGQDGRSVDSMTVTQGPSARLVILPRAAVFPIKGRDDGLGTIYCLYQSANAVIRPWLVMNIEPQKDYTRITGANWRTEVFAGDTATLPAPPVREVFEGVGHDDANI